MTLTLYNAPNLSLVLIILLPLYNFFHAIYPILYSFLSFLTPPIVHTLSPFAMLLTLHNAPDLSQILLHPSFLTHPLQFFNQLWFDFSAQVSKCPCPLEVTYGSVLIVGADAMFSSSLDIHGSKIEAGEGNSGVLEEMVGDFLSQKVVECLHGC